MRLGVSNVAVWCVCAGYWPFWEFWSLCTPCCCPLYTWDISVHGRMLTIVHRGLLTEVCLWWWWLLPVSRWHSSLLSRAINTFLRSRSQEWICRRFFNDVAYYSQQQMTKAEEASAESAECSGILCEDVGSCMELLAFHPRNWLTE